MPMLQSLSFPSTSWALLALANRKQDKAWTTITKVYAPLVYGWSRRCGLQDFDASDATQDVFLKVFLNLDKCEQIRGRFRSWLWTITRNTVIQHFRNQKKRPALLNHDLLELHSRGPEFEPEDANPDHIPNEVLLRTLEVIRPKFKERTFQAGWRTIALGLSPDDVATGLGMTTGAVYIAKSRLLKELRNVFAELENWQSDCSL